MRLLKILLFIFLCIEPFSLLHAARIKDITNIKGVRDNQLVGYGLVVGLDGTGDHVSQTQFTQQTFINMLLRFGIRLPYGANLQLKNIAAVAISATLPPFTKQGQKIDITVASLGNATSLRGGELLLTPLRGADGQVYAMAQGSVVVSGFGAQGGDGSKVIVNVTCSGRVPNGATVERTLPIPFAQNGVVTFELTQPDFTTALSIQKAINEDFKRHIAYALDANSIQVRVGNLPPPPPIISVFDHASGIKGEIERVSNAADNEAYQAALMARLVPIIARIENINVNPADVKARVIVNSRTGTIVVDQNVTISPVAVSHGNLSVVVSERPFVSQPQGFSNGKTVVGTASDINVNQQPARTFLFAPGASLKDLVDAINAVGAAPGDLIAILEAIKAAGALHADLEVI